MHFLTLFLFLFFACTKPSPWAFDQVHSHEEEFRSTKLAYRSHNPVNGIDLEILKTHEHLNAFLNIRSMPIPPLKNDPKGAILLLTIDGKNVRHKVYRFDGGQRFLLSEETTSALIEALKNHQDVSLSLSGYTTLVKAEDFAAKFEKLLHPFPLANPFHLPL